MRSVTLFLVFTLACGGKKEEAPAPKETPPPTAQAAPVTAGVQLYVGSDAVATVTPDQVKDWPRVDSFLPEAARRLGKWQAISTKGTKTAELARPFETYRDYVPALFPGEGNTIAFGLFDPVEYGKRGKPALREDAITELRVTLDAAGMRGENDHGGGEVTDPAKVELTVITPKGEQKLQGTKILELPREAQPGNDAVKGWTLKTLLGAAGITTFSKLRLTDANGTSIPLDKPDLGADTLPFVKLNRQGSLRFRLYKKQGEGWQPGADLRALAKIEVLQ